MYACTLLCITTLRSTAGAQGAALAQHTSQACRHTAGEQEAASLLTVMFLQGVCCKAAKEAQSGPAMHMHLRCCCRPKASVIPNLTDIYKAPQPGPRKVTGMTCHASKSAMRAAGVFAHFHVVSFTCVLSHVSSPQAGQLYSSCT